MTAKRQHGVPSTSNGSRRPSKAQAAGRRKRGRAFDMPLSQAKQLKRELDHEVKIVNDFLDEDPINPMPSCPLSSGNGEMGTCTHDSFPPGGCRMTRDECQQHVGAVFQPELQPAAFGTAAAPAGKKLSSTDKRVGRMTIKQMSLALLSACLDQKQERQAYSEVIRQLGALINACDKGRKDLVDCFIPTPSGVVSVKTTRERSKLIPRAAVWKPTPKK